MDHGHAGRDRRGRRVDPRGLTIQEHLARIGPVEAEEDLHQGALAGPVLAEERVHLAGMDVEVDGVVGEYTGKALGDAGELEQRCVHGRVSFMG